MLLIEAGVLVSRSPVSGLVHFLILAAVYPLLVRCFATAVPRIEPTKG